MPDQDTTHASTFPKSSNMTASTGTEKSSTVGTAQTQVVGVTTTPASTSATYVAPGGSTGSAGGSAAKESETSGGQGKARAVVEGAKDAATHAVEGASALLHEAGDKAAESYAYLARSADALGDRAGAAVDTVVRQGRRAGSSIGSFVGAHALPLLMIGAGLSWLTLSMRKQRSYDLMPEDSMRYRELEGPEVEYRREYRRDRAAPTTTGNKLLGVRMRDTGYADGI